MVQQTTEQVSGIPQRLIDEVLRSQIAQQARRSGAGLEREQGRQRGEELQEVESGRVIFEVRGAQETPMPQLVETVEERKITIQAPASKADLFFFAPRVVGRGFEEVIRQLSPSQTYNRNELRAARAGKKDEKREQTEIELLAEIQGEIQIDAAPKAIARVTRKATDNPFFLGPPRQAGTDPEALTSYAKKAVKFMADSDVDAGQLVGSAKRGQMRYILDTQAAIMFAPRVERKKMESTFFEGMERSLENDEAAEQAKQLLTQIKPAEPQLTQAIQNTYERYPYDAEELVRNSKIDLSLLISNMPGFQTAISDQLEQHVKRGKRSPASEHLWQLYYRYVHGKDDAGTASQLLEDALDQEPDSPHRQLARDKIMSWCPDLTSADLNNHSIALQENEPARALTASLLQTQERFENIELPRQEEERRVFIDEHFLTEDKGKRKKPQEILASLMETAQADSEEGKMARYHLSHLAKEVPNMKNHDVGAVIRKAQAGGASTAFRPNLLRMASKSQTAEERLNIPIEAGALTNRTRDALAIMAGTDDGFTWLNGTRFDPGTVESSGLWQEMAGHHTDTAQVIIREFDSAQEAGNLKEMMLMPSLLFTLAGLTTSSDPKKRALINALMYSDSTRSLERALTSSATTWTAGKDLDTGEYRMMLINAAEAAVSAIPPGWNDETVPREYAKALTDQFTNLVLGGLIDYGLAPEEPQSPEEKQRKEIGGFSAALAYKFASDRHVPVEVSAHLLKRVNLVLGAIGQPLMFLKPSFIKLVKSVATHSGLKDHPEIERDVVNIVNGLLHDIVRAAEAKIGQHALEWTGEEVGEGSEHVLEGLADFINVCYPDAEYFHLRPGDIPLVGSTKEDMPDLSLAALNKSGKQRLQSSVDELGLPGLNSQPTTSKQDAALAMGHLVQTLIAKFQTGEGALKSQHYEAKELGQRATDARTSNEPQDMAESILIGADAQRATESARRRATGQTVIGQEVDHLLFWYEHLLNRAGFEATVQSGIETRGLEVGSTSLRVNKVTAEPHPFVTQMGPGLYEAIRQRFSLNLDPVSPEELRRYKMAINQKKRELGLE